MFPAPFRMKSNTKPKYSLHLRAYAKHSIQFCAVWTARADSDFFPYYKKASFTSESEKYVFRLLVHIFMTFCGSPKLSTVSKGTQTTTATKFNTLSYILPERVLSTMSNEELLLTIPLVGM